MVLQLQGPWGVSTHTETWVEVWMSENILKELFRGTYHQSGSQEEVKLI